MTGEGPASHAVQRGGAWRRTRWPWILALAALAVGAAAWFVPSDRTSPVVPPNHPAVVEQVGGRQVFVPDSSRVGVFFVSQDPRDTIRVWDDVARGIGEVVDEDLPEGHTFLIMGGFHRDSGVRSSVSRIDEGENGVITLHHTKGSRGGDDFVELSGLGVYFLVALPEGPVDVDQYHVESYFID